MGAGHGIGIKRNDYHRRNRRRNISMHSHSHGRNVPVNSAMLLEKAATIPVEIPRFADDELCAKAKAYMESSRFHNDRKDTVERNCVNYLRHQCSPYETFYQAGPRDEDLALLIAKRVFDAIACAYPWLEAECHTQYEERNRGLINVGGGVKLMRRSMRLARRFMTGTLTSEQIKEMNAREDGEPEPEIAGYIGEDDGTFRDPALSSLASVRLLYQPPFLKREEIIARRFTDQYGEMNDRWWEWEEEKQLKVPEREQRFRWTT